MEVFHTTGMQLSAVKKNNLLTCTNIHTHDTVIHFSQHANVTVRAQEITKERLQIDSEPLHFHITTFDHPSVPLSLSSINVELAEGGDALQLGK